MIEIGPFTAYELPGQLTWQFLDDDGDPMDLTGFTVKYHHLRHGGSTVTRAGVLVTPASGIVGYSPVAADLNTAGVYKGQFEVGNGVNRYYSDDIVYRVKEAVAAGTT